MGVLFGADLMAGGPGLDQSAEQPPSKTRGPVVISTWRHGVEANKVAAMILQVSGNVIDAVEKGVRVIEEDPKITSVGYGGNPNRDGVVELDAAIMDGSNLEAGAVAGIRGIKTPISVARLVMEKTRHVLLVGEGAREFALSQGFKEEDLLTDRAKKAWEKWKKDPKHRVPGQVDDHDTVGMVAMDKAGGMAAACTTSGLSWKLPGRVGDSPLIGDGLYCDGKAGGATATGIGEEVIKVCGSYQVVEFMRQGLHPNEAIRRVLERVIQRDPRNKERSVAFVAIRADGEVGHGSTIPGFQAAITRGTRTELVNSSSLVQSEKKR
jgi:L-asparaginase/N4-(beta-N-acetylglucosaminyl)-L-asparaginase